MFVLALVPGLWFAVMNPRVAAWAQGRLDRINVLATQRANLAHRYSLIDRPTSTVS